MKYKAVFTVLKFFYLAILTFKKGLVLAIGNITEVHFQDVEIIFKRMYHEIGVKPHYYINIWAQGYFEWSILSCSLISSLI